MSLEAFDHYVKDSLECRDALAAIYVAFSAFRSTVDPLERGIQCSTIIDALAKVGYE